MSTNRFVFGDHAVSNNLAARVSPKSSAVRRIRESVIRTEGPDADSCRPIPRPAGTSSTIHHANVKAAEAHSMKAKRAKSMPSGMQAKHMAQHSNLQRAYMIACTSNNTTSHPDPLVLSQLSDGVLTVDMMLYEDGDMNSVCRLLQCRTAANELEGIVVSCGELRGAKSSMKRIGWETSDLPRSVLVGGPRSPSKAKQRSSNGKAKDLIKSICYALKKCKNLTHLEFTGINLTALEIKLLASGLRGNTLLSNFTMRRVLLGDEGASELVPSLAQTQAEVIVLSHCGLTDRSRGSLVHIVKSGCCRRDEMTWAKGLRGKGGFTPTSAESPGGIPGCGVLCFDLSFNRLGSAFAIMLSHALIHDGWLLGLNLEGNKINMEGATSMVEMLVTNKFVCAIKMEGNRCVKDEKGRRGLMMMKTLLGKRSVPSGDQEGMWEGVLDLIEEWRGEDEGDGGYQEGSDSFQAYNDDEVEDEDELIMSPSGLKFGESFVDDDEEEEGGGEADVNSLGSEIVKLEASEVGEGEGADDDGDEEVEEEKPKKKAALKKRKGKKKKKKVNKADKKLNLNMSIPRLPPAVGGRPDVPAGRVSPDAPPVSYLSMEPEDFEKALFGPGSRKHGKGINGVVKAAAGGAATSPSKRPPARKKPARRAKGLWAAGASGATTASPVILKKGLKKKRAVLSSSEGSTSLSVPDSSGPGDDKVILSKIESMIQTMSSELSAMEKQAGKKGKGKSLKGGGKGTAKDGLIAEISNQVAVRLKEIWEEEE
mmetsp:Transcript_27514/g.52149  ORF Transcript_27514/g.52149 Transcript_27514/m.52149 type:complete len:764 (+) Transcript_27514:53-2344(+)